MKHAACTYQVFVRAPVLVKSTVSEVQSTTFCYNVSLSFTEHYTAYQNATTARYIASRDGVRCHIDCKPPEVYKSIAVMT